MENERTLPAGSRAPTGIAWEGPFLLMHSFSVVNRELCLKLIERGHELTIIPSDGQTNESAAAGAPKLLTDRFHRPLARAVDVHVRHQWPPNFTPPPQGHWVLMQPWEFGSLPRSWAGPMAEEIDEVWVYSHYLRDCYVKSGVPAERVHVVPLGVDPGRFRPQATPLPLRTKKRFRFLFVGGTIHRKGIDVLLGAYREAFRADDDVCLVIKDLGAGSFYRGKTAEGQIAQHQGAAGAPEIEYLDRRLTELELAGLYTACDCLVHPYRGEGFGLPIAEAMACGLPVIVTGYGAALDFCRPDTAFLVPATPTRFREQRIDDLPTVHWPWMAEPDAQALKHYLREVFERPAEARARGHAGAAHIRQHFTWDHAATAAEARLQALRERPIRRFSKGEETGPTAPVVRPAVRQRVSLCMIVKNEADKLGDCLRSATDLVDETIVVDTGSTDGTREVAARFGARVIDFAWVDNFAAARNESVRHACGDWIFWLDADEWLDEDNRRKVRALFAGLRDEPLAYVMKQLSVPAEATGPLMGVDQVRLFRRDPAVRWQYRVHEQILLAVRRAGHEVRWTDVVITHAGYQERQLSREKLERNIALLHLQDTEQPDDPITLYHLGLAYQQAGRFVEAITLLRRSLQKAPTDYSFRPKLYAVLARTHHRLGQATEALEACRAGREQFPEDIELLFMEGLVLFDRGELAKAEVRLRELLAVASRQQFGSLDAGLRGFKGRHLLAQVCQAQGRAAEAEAQWRAAVAEQPDFGPAWQGLGELYLAECRWRELDEAADRLAPVAKLEAMILRARACLARKEFGGARSLLEEAIEHHSQVVTPRLWLSRTLLQEGRDWAGAEKALREVLRLHPNHPEAGKNLAVLIGQQGAAAGSLFKDPNFESIQGAKGVERKSSGDQGGIGLPS